MENFEAHIEDQKDRTPTQCNACNLEQIVLYVAITCPGAYSTQAYQYEDEHSKVDCSLSGHRVSPTELFLICPTKLLRFFVRFIWSPCVYISEADDA
jgi:hypothetical protein